MTPSNTFFGTVTAPKSRCAGWTNRTILEDKLGYMIEEAKRYRRTDLDLGADSVRDSYLQKVIDERRWGRFFLAILGGPLRWAGLRASLAFLDFLLEAARLSRRRCPLIRRFARATIGTLAVSRTGMMRLLASVLVRGVSGPGGDQLMLGAEVISEVGVGEPEAVVSSDSLFRETRPRESLAGDGPARVHRRERGLLEQRPGWGAPAAAGEVRIWFDWEAALAERALQRNEAYTYWHGVLPWALQVGTTRMTFLAFEARGVTPKFKVELSRLGQPLVVGILKTSGRIGLELAQVWADRLTRIMMDQTLRPYTRLEVCEGAAFDVLEFAILKALNLADLAPAVRPGHFCSHPGSAFLFSPLCADFRPMAEVAKAADLSVYERALIASQTRLVALLFLCVDLVGHSDNAGGRGRRCFVVDPLAALGLSRTKDDSVYFTIKPGLLARGPADGGPLSQPALIAALEVADWPNLFHAADQLPSVLASCGWEGGHSGVPALMFRAAECLLPHLERLASTDAVDRVLTPWEESAGLDALFVVPEGPRELPTTIGPRLAERVRAVLAAVVGSHATYLKHADWVQAMDPPAAEKLRDNSKTLANAWVECVEARVRSLVAAMAAARERAAGPAAGPARGPATEAARERTGKWCFGLC
jgi:hypothetical protein